MGTKDTFPVYGSKIFLESCSFAFKTNSSIVILFNNKGISLFNCITMYFTHEFFVMIIIVHRVAE